MALIILAVSFTLLLILGVPVAFSIGISSLLTIFYEGLPLSVGFQQMDSGMNPFSFLAIPFFIFTGELMLYGGIADKIIGFAKALAGHMRGGLGMTNVIACTLFGGVSGSPIADVSAMGSVLIPQMKKEGYDADYAVNVTTHASLVGALMPTSHNLIIFALAASGKASISTLILAGIVPAIILTLCNLGAAYFVAVKRGYPAGTFPGFKILVQSFASAVPGLLIVVIIIAGILSGAFTATEAASVAVIWALFLATIVYRKLTKEQFLKAAVKTVKNTGSVLLLIGISSMFGYLIGLYEVPEMTGRFLKGISNEPWVIFLWVNILLFIIGTFLDMAATLLICTPIFLPICQYYGMSTEQFGIVILINCALGLNTPPVGTTQFIGCTIGEISVGAVMKTIWPFYGGLILALMLVTYIPPFTMWLPSVVLK